MQKTYNLCKLELENIYDKQAEGAKIRSKCEWYQLGEKPTKFFLKVEKQKAINTTVRHLIDDGKDITNLKEINACISEFYKNFLKRMSLNQIRKRNRFQIVSLTKPHL